MGDGIIFFYVLTCISPSIWSGMMSGFLSSDSEGSSIACPCTIPLAGLTGGFPGDPAGDPLSAPNGGDLPPGLAPLRLRSWIKLYIICTAEFKKQRKLNSILKENSLN